MDIVAQTSDLIRKGEFIQAARLLHRQPDLSRYDPRDLLKFRGQFPTPFLNIGGGPSFCYPLWANLDSAAGPLNETPFDLSQRFPFEDSSFELVYSSHAIEHLNDQAVHHVLSEAKRLLKPSGCLVVKIPDFNAVQRAWRANDEDYLSIDRWGFSTVVPTLKNKGLTDSIDTRAAYIFCGYWNKAFGNVFSGFNIAAPGAYNGPAPLPKIEMRAILSLESPNEISRAFVGSITDEDKTFNHQNAWSDEEFITLLRSHGFTVVCDKDRVSERFSYIPGISQMTDISSYFVAFP